MELIIWHGYLLSETGSNIYVQNITRELCRLGHNVHLFTQENDLSDYDFISRKYIFDDDNELLILESERESRFDGSCFAYQPSISGLLPVFVYDDYEGFKVKLFMDLTGDELLNYNNKNIAAIDLVMNTYEIDGFIADHGAISPYLAKETCVKRSVPYTVIIQGSDLEFLIKKSKRYYDLSLEGLKGASSVIAVTDHIKREISQLYFGCLDDLVKVIPSGVDLETFKISVDRSQSVKDLTRATKSFQKKRDNGFSEEIQGKTLRDLGVDDINDKTLWDIHKSYDDKAPDRDIMKKLSTFSGSDRFVTFVGKLMVTKGPHLAIAAIGKILLGDKKVKHVIVGFGDLREHLEILVIAIATKDVDKLFLISKMIDDKLNTRDYLSEFYRDLQERGELDDYLDASADIGKRVIFTGLLRHDQIKHMLAITDIHLTLSIFPEAFGLVVLEGTASGAIPVTSNHSGLKDVLTSLEEKGGLADNLYRLNLSKNAIARLTGMMKSIFKIDDDERIKLSQAFSELTSSEYGWPAVTERLLEHIDELIIDAKNL